jgi:sarcosine oxidase, subunit gamma
MVEMYQSPLSHRSESTATSVGLREISTRGMIDLRGFANDRRFMAAAQTVLGFALPTAHRSSASWGDRKALWLSVDQWLILAPRERIVELHNELEKVLTGIHALAVNVSDMRAIIRIEGAHGREVLMKGTSLDLVDGSYLAGTVRRMRFAEIAALLHVVEDTVLDVYVFRSYADYTWEFLLKAARKGSEVRLFSKA